MKKYQFYDEIFYIGIKKNKSTIKKDIKDLLEVATQNRATNVTMAEANQKDLAYFPETAMWCVLRPIETPVMEAQN